MAVRAVVQATQVDIMVRVFTWSGLLQSSLDTGAPVDVRDAAELMCMINGTLGAAGAVTWEGSVDGGVNYFPLKSNIGTPAAIVQTAVLTPDMVQERPLTVRPRVTAGDGTTTLVATLVAKRVTG